MPKQMITRTAQILCDVDDGLAAQINAWEDDGWAVKFLECHVQHPEMRIVHTVVVFEKEVNVP